MAKSTPEERKARDAGRQAAERVEAGPAATATVGDWIAGARPRTLGLAVGGVLAAWGIAAYVEPFRWLPPILCLVVALALQIGVNFANDYSDGVRGTDKDRVGPGRITAAGKAPARTVRNVAFGCFGLAAFAGLIAVLVTGHWWLLLIGVVAIPAAWFYTGGKRPYGYLALGELVSGIFFGPVLVAGTVYAITGNYSEDALFIGCAFGMLSAALMLTNNIRDLETDRAAGKRTVPTLIGRPWASVLFAALVIGPFIIASIYVLVLMHGGWMLLALVPALPAVVMVLMAKRPKDYILALSLTGIAALVLGITAGIAFWGGVTGFNNPYV